MTLDDLNEYQKRVVEALNELGTVYIGISEHNSDFDKLIEKELVKRWQTSYGVWMARLTEKGLNLFKDNDV